MTAVIILSNFLSLIKKSENTIVGFSFAICSNAHGKNLWVHVLSHLLLSKFDDFHYRELWRNVEKVHELSEKILTS